VWTECILIGAHELEAFIDTLPSRDLPPVSLEKNVNSIQGMFRKVNDSVKMFATCTKIAISYLSCHAYFIQAHLNDMRSLRIKNTLK
jgi:hypothetical protein